MRKTIATICVVASVLTMFVSTAVCEAQVLLSPAFKQANDDEKEKSLETTVRLHAMPQTDPLLRYRLWPAPEKRRPRAAMVAVNRALILVAQVSSTKKREFLDQYDAWIALPIDELPIAEARASYTPFETAIGVLRTGENWMDLNYDLGMQDMSAQDKISTLLPEYQEMRDLARLLCLRARVAVAEERWEDAIADLRLGFRLSEIASHGTDTLLSHLIGTAISEVMLDTIESMIQHPDCPNLYWAIAALPVDRLFDYREAIEYESTFSNHLGSVAGLSELPGEIIGEEESLLRLKKTAKGLATMFRSMGRPSGNSSMSQMTTGVEIALMVEPSRQLLAENPIWKDRVDELSDAEVVLRASEFELSRIRDRWLAWALLPDELWDEADDERRKAMQAAMQTTTLGGRLARMMTPSIRTAASIGLNIKQKHHRLLTLEALRMHAAQSGSLPESLKSMKPVPAWRDPVAHESFDYVRESATEATLTMAEGLRKQDDLTLKIKLEVNQ